MNTLELSKMLAYEHFEAEPALTKVAIFTAENDQEIRLLEVNNDAMPSGCVQPFVFRPSGNLPVANFRSRRDSERMGRRQGVAYGVAERLATATCRGH